MEPLSNKDERNILAWYASGHRNLPWRQGKDPYRIWISEIMLQQTRAEAVIPYYLRFLEQFPDIRSLGSAEDDVLMKCWQGLGYYSRARNLKKAALKILSAYGGRFPEDPAEIAGLPGIGPYTAAAISSICFNLPEPAVDGNVLRVMARFRELDLPVDRQNVKEEIGESLQSAYRDAASRHMAGTLTQSLMELGAVVCIPHGTPSCGSCPLRISCMARIHESWQKYPLREKKKPRKKEYRAVWILSCGGTFAVRQRPEKGLLAGLWEFPNAVCPWIMGQKDAEKALEEAVSLGCNPGDITEILPAVHIFTHIEWHMKGYFISCKKKPPEFTWVTADELKGKYAVPSAFSAFLEQIYHTTLK